MRILFSFLLLATLHLAYGQSTESKSILGKEYYLKKSKRQKTWWWITGGTGLGVFTAGLIMYMSEFGNGLPGGTGYNEKTSKTGEALMYVGGGLVLVAVPFQIAYKRNEKIAASFSIRYKPVVYPQSEDRTVLGVSSLCLRIGLNRQ